MALMTFSQTQTISIKGIVYGLESVGKPNKDGSLIATLTPIKKDK